MNKAPLVLMLLAVSAANAEITWLTVAGDSMAPILTSGNRVKLDTAAYSSNAPQTGDLVAIQFRSRERAMVKRIAAVEGDTVNIIDGKLYRNHQYTGQPVKKRGKVSRILAGQLQRYGNLLPPRNYIVLGDNPNTSYDSRSYGFIAAEQIIGKIALADNTVQAISSGGVK